MPRHGLDKVLTPIQFMNLSSNYCILGRTLEFLPMIFSTLGKILAHRHRGIEATTLVIIKLGFMELKILLQIFSKRKIWYHVVPNGY